MLSAPSSERHRECFDARTRQSERCDRSGFSRLPLLPECRRVTADDTFPIMNTCNRFCTLKRQGCPQWPRSRAASSCPSRTCHLPSCQAFRDKVSPQCFDSRSRGSWKVRLGKSTTGCSSNEDSSDLPSERLSIDAEAPRTYGTSGRPEMSHAPPSSILKTSSARRWAWNMRSS